MSRSPFFTTLLVIALVGAQPLARGNPADQLAPVPEPTQVEKEVIGLLQIDRTSIDQAGDVTIAFYNPTKYTLTSAVIRVQIPSMKIDRIYFSGRTNIVPFGNGEFGVGTKIYSNPSPKDFKCEIVKVSFDKSKA